jgi:hypothetical protein
MEINKSKMATKLRLILESNKFARFYSDNGELGKSITGEYYIGSPERAANEAKIKEYLNQIIEELIK